MSYSWRAPPGPESRARGGAFSAIFSSPPRARRASSPLLPGRASLLKHGSTSSRSTLGQRFRAGAWPGDHPPGGVRARGGALSGGRRAASIRAEIRAAPPGAVQRRRPDQDARGRGIHGDRRRPKKRGCWSMPRSRGPSRRRSFPIRSAFPSRRIAFSPGRRTSWKPLRCGWNRCIGGAGTGSRPRAALSAGAWT